MDASLPNLSFLDGGGAMGELMRSMDWAQTPLGPPPSWPAALRTSVSTCLNCAFPILIWWGPELAMLYNDEYRAIIGTHKHPFALGAAGARVWPEIWNVIGPMLRQVTEQRRPARARDLLLLMDRNGYTEETYFSFSYSPIVDEAGSVAGVFCPVIETTQKVISERRLKVLRDLAALNRSRHNPGEMCVDLARELRNAAHDIPFALFYLVEDAHTARLCATSGFDDHPGGAPPLLQLDAAGVADGAAEDRWPLARAQTGPLLLDDLDARFAALPTGAWPERPNKAWIMPIVLPGRTSPTAFLIAAVSPRRELDTDYATFFTLVADQARSALATVEAFNEERRRAQALAAVDQAKTEFFSNVSHEFRTPLTLMLGPLDQAMADPQMPPRLHGQLALAYGNSMRLLKLVNSLLDFSRIEAGRGDACYEPTDLPALTRDLASTFRSAMQRAGLGYGVSCDAIDEPVYVDRDMWEKIVLNLLSNAFKFTLRGSVSLRLRRRDGRVSLEVADTGVGIPASELPRLFERFHRIAGVEGRTHEGSGIGLALVQELVKLHGGTIDASSEPGVGTVFRVLLPLGSAHLPVERVAPRRANRPADKGAESFVQEALRWLPEAGSPAGAPALIAPDPASAGRLDRRFASTFGARIVIADDNADMRSYLRQLLSTHYSVEAVADGAAALGAMRSSPPDLLLSDVMMPRVDGFGLLSAIRNDRALREVPVVMLSARAGEEARIEGFDAGADDYLIKPFSGRELLARVGALLELRQMRRLAREEFRLRTAQFETLLAAAPLGVFLVDGDFRIREVNPTARPAFGGIPDVIGRDFDEVMHILWPNAHADEIVRRFRHTLVTGESHVTSEQIEMRLDRGVTEYYEWQISRIPVSGGHGVVCYFRDISAQVAARRELLRQRAALQIMDRHKDEFLAMLSHELRNPLAPLRFAGELLARGGMPGEARKAAGIVKRQVDHMTRLVDDLLDVSRITQGRIELRRQPVSLSEIMTQAVEIVDPLMRERRHEVSIAGGETLHVDGDGARLVQCVANLLTNAAKFTEPGGRIRVRCAEDQGTAMLSVADNGAGIPADLLPRVFDLFVQGGRTLDRAQGGLGIGLSLVRELVVRHGGSVEAHSDGPGLGSTFVIRLPLIDAGTTNVEPPSRPAHRPRRILLVDDNADAADSLAMVLEADGHAVCAVYSAQHALERIGEFAPEVVLLDIGLPLMDGFQLARSIKAMQGLGPLRLVALTGYGQSEDRRRALDAGFDDLLIKPIPYDDLHSYIQTR